MNGYGKALVFWALMLFVACAVLGVACNGNDDDVTPISTPSTQSLEHIQVIVIQVIREKAPNTQISATQLDELAKQIAALQPKDDAQIRSFAELVIASGLANVPAPATTPASGATGGSCQPGDKVATFPEGNNQHRIEVGGHGAQHIDFYTAHGIPAVSYIIPGIADPDGIPNIWWGYGSLWEWNPPGCKYDFVADVTKYVRARLDSGHSGLIIDLRGGKDEKGNDRPLYYKVVNMSDENIVALLLEDFAAMELNDKSFNVETLYKRLPQLKQLLEGTQQSSAQPPVKAPPVSQAQVYVPSSPPVAAPAAPAVSAAPALDCTGVKLPDKGRDQGADTKWTIGGDGASYNAHVWNPAAFNGERKLHVKEGESIALSGFGGSTWRFAPGCEEASQKDYNQDTGFAPFS